MSGELTFETRWGPCHMSWTERGVSGFRLPPRRGQSSGNPPASVRKAVALVTAYFDGVAVDFSPVTLDLDGLTPFRARVYRALREVPRGHVVDYAELASKAGSPGAARAVGQAMAHNPLPLFVPCHRVVAASGKLGGFSAPGGATTKRRLLEMEALPVTLRNTIAIPAHPVLTLGQSHP